MIRDAVESDLPSLGAAMLRLQEAHVSALPQIYRRFDIDEALTHLTELRSRSDAIIRVAVLIKDGVEAEQVTQDQVQDVVVGHAVFFIETRKQSMFTHAQRIGRIAQIEVEPVFRRQGYGQSLIDDCERLANEHDLSRIVLDVWSFNNSAKSFYSALGFQDDGCKMSRTVTCSKPR